MIKCEVGTKETETCVNNSRIYFFIFILLHRKWADLIITSQQTGHQDHCWPGHEADQQSVNILERNKEMTSSPFFFFSCHGIFILFQNELRSNVYRKDLNMSMIIDMKC